MDELVASAHRRGWVRALSGRPGGHTVTIRAKLALGLLAIALVLLLPLGFSLRQLGRLHQAMRQLRERDYAAQLLLSSMRGTTDDIRAGEYAVLFVDGPAGAARMDTLIGRLGRATDSLARLDSAGAIGPIRAAVAEIARVAPLEAAAAAAGRDSVADSLSTRYFVPAITRTERALLAEENVLQARTSALVGRTASETEQARAAAGGALAIASVLALVIAVLLWRSISRPVRELDAGMSAVAGGNFGYPLQVSPTRRDEFGRLATSFRTMQEQLGQLDRLKAEFISVASHELKTPINVVLGYLQLIEDGVYGQVGPKVSEILRTVDAQTRSLSRLVHQLLDVSRFEAGGGKLELRRVDLPAFVRELEDTFRVLSLQRGIDFRIETSGELPAEVLWDSDRVNEVLGNLLTNAFKFTGQGGTIELGIEPAPQEIRLMVRDTGAGIPPEQLPHIFEKFYQADNQGAASHGGTGLGLAIAKQIVSAHGGVISVHSTPGVGTSFWITLPLRAGGRVSGVHPRERESAGARA